MANLQAVSKKFDFPLLKEELQDILNIMQQRIEKRGGTG
jgi:hypothetical protein